MPHLSLSLLGPFQVALDKAPVSGFEYNKVRALLAYLAVEARQAHHREVLAELLWPERLSETARANLRKTLSTLRQVIGDENQARPFLLTTRETVQFNLASDHTLDVAQFVDHLETSAAHRHHRGEDCAACLQRWEQATELYRGDFLDQFFINDSPAFEMWLKSRREALRRQALETFVRLAAAHEARREYAAAIRLAQRQVELDAADEAAHRQLMRLYFQQGQRQAALAQYETCRRILAEELEVTPDQQTMALYEQIRAATPSPIGGFSDGGGVGEGVQVPPRNPYALRGMIKDPANFVGRKAEQREIFNRLGMMQSCSIVGPRRIGKSSLLYYLTQPVIYQQHLPDAGQYIFAFVDLQELAGAGPEDFFAVVVERLTRTSGGRLAADPEPTNTPAGFRRFLARATESGLKLALGCDEFEGVSDNPRFTADFFTYLRGLCSNYNLALITASQASLFDLCHRGGIQTSQFWNIFTEQSVGLMPEQETQTILSHPAFTNEDRALIQRLAGPHPFFLQIAAYHVFEARVNNGQLETAAIEERFFADSQRHYAYAWEHLDEAERRILTTLARAEPLTPDESRFHSLRRKALMLGRPESPALISAGWRRFILER
jgi:DNA-binding SARP family transcriptional activator